MALLQSIEFVSLHCCLDYFHEIMCDNLTIFYLIKRKIGATNFLEFFCNSTDKSIDYLLRRFNLDNGKHHVVCEMTQCPDRLKIVKLIQMKRGLKRLHSVGSVKCAVLNVHNSCASYLIWNIRAPQYDLIKSNIRVLHLKLWDWSTDGKFVYSVPRKCQLVLLVKYAK